MLQLTSRWHHCPKEIQVSRAILSAQQSWAGNLDQLYTRQIKTVSQATSQFAEHLPGKHGPWVQSPMSLVRKKNQVAVYDEQDLFLPETETVESLSRQ